MLMSLASGVFVTCDVCGFYYLSQREDRRHTKYHADFLQLRKIYGEDNILNYKERETLKHAGWSIVFDSSEDFNKRCLAAENILRAWFSRSAISLGPRYIHPKFDEYIALMLHQQGNENMFPEDVYNFLINKYNIESLHYKYKPLGNSSYYEGRALRKKEA